MSNSSEFPPGCEVFPQTPIVAAPPGYVPTPPGALIGWSNMRTLYQCSICGEWWLASNPTVSCCVAHSPGTCCHFGDVKPDPTPLDSDPA